MSQLPTLPKPKQNLRSAPPPPDELTEIGLVPIRLVKWNWLVPSRENDRLYRPINPNEPAIRKMAAAMKAEGQIEPTVATNDGYIVSGHRRRVAAKLAGLTDIPCRVLPFSRSDDPERVYRLLRLFNDQRVKTADEQLREAVIDANPEDAYRAIRDHRRAQLHPMPVNVTLKAKKERAEISDAKRPYLEAVQKIIQDNRQFWPLSLRSIHYQLQNDPPLRHAGKPGSRYRNNLQCYKDLSDLCTRARLTGEIPMSAIDDDTRPVTTWQVWDNVGDFITREVDDFLKGYARNMMRTQPDHLEIICEKMTLKNVIDDVASEYMIPTTIGRGYGSIPPRRDMAQRFRISGKDRMVVLLLTDFDPEGEDIAETFTRSMRDDFDVVNIAPVKVTLTSEQVRKYKLPVKLQAKATSSRFKEFSAKHGTDVFELEALPLQELQTILRDAIDRTIDVAAFNAEVDRYKDDAQFLAGVRRTVKDTLAGIDFEKARAEE